MSKQRGAKNEPSSIVNKQPTPSPTKAQTHAAKSKQNANKKKVRLFSKLNLQVPLPATLMMILPSLKAQQLAQAEELAQDSSESHNAAADTSTSSPTATTSSSAAAEEAKVAANVPQTATGNMAPQPMAAKGRYAFTTSAHLTQHAHALIQHIHLPANQLAAQPLHANGQGEQQTRGQQPISSGQPAQPDKATNDHDHTQSANQTRPPTTPDTATETKPQVQPEANKNTSNNSQPKPDNGAHHEAQVSFIAGTLQGKFGQLEVDQQGHYRFTLDNQSPEFIKLQGQQHAIDGFSLKLTDGTELLLQIPVTGQQEQPQISGDLSANLQEDVNVSAQGLLTTQGKIDVVDPDQNESAIQAQTIQGQYGSFTINAQGQWHYQVDNSLATIQALTSHSALHESFIIHTQDGTPQTLQMQIGGNDDKALISGVDTGQTTEESKIQTQGQLSVIDADLQQDHFQATGLQGIYGQLHLSETGRWRYDLDNASPKVQALAQGQQATDTFTVQSADGTPHQITVHINGANDGALIAGSDSGSVTEDNPLHLQAQGQLTIQDIDSGEAHFIGADILGVFGALHMTDTGSWSYDLDNASPKVQALAQGQQATDTFTVQSADGTPHQITVHINGANDGALIAGSDSGSVTEDNPLHLQAQGQLTIQDIDSGEAHFIGADILGVFGALHMTDTGSWRYDLDNASPKVQALAQGQQATDTFTVQSADGTPHQITVHINGANDGALIAGSDSGSVTEDNPLHLQAQGQLTIQDIDSGEAKFSAGDITGALGILHLQANGAWVYDLDSQNPRVQALAKNGLATDTVNITALDGTTHQVTIDVHGSNDAAVIKGTTAGAVTEDHIQGMQWLVFSGKMTITDADAGEAAFDPVLHAHNFAGIGYTSALGAQVIISPDGDWHYQLDNNLSQVQALGQGQSYVDTVTVHSKDGTAQLLQITISGTNDAPLVTGSRILPSAVEDHSVRLTQKQLLSGISDLDNNDVGSLHIDAVTADHGHVSQQADGSFLFQPDANYNGAVQFSYQVKDSHGGSSSAHASITLAAAPDAAIITGQDSGDAFENKAGIDMSPDYAQPGISKLVQAPLYVDGKLDISDPDAGQAEFDSKGGTFAYQGQYGHLLLQPDGHWHYAVSAGQVDWHHQGNPVSVGSRIDQLGAGQTLTDTITIAAKDGTTHDIVITIHGDNDAPYVLGAVQLGTGKEDLIQTITARQLLAHTVDVDANDAGQLTIAHLRADHGSILDNQDGTFSFTPDPNYNGKVTFNYDVKDGHGASTAAVAETLLSPQQDAATITGLSTGSVKEDALTQASGQLTVQDPDKGESQFVAVTHAQAPHQAGTYSITQDGHWTFTLNPNRQSLHEGEQVQDYFEVTSLDGTTHRINITTVGSADKPSISGDISATLVDGATTSISGQMLVSDKDWGQSGTQRTNYQQALDSDNHLGQYEIDNDGHWTFSLNKHQPQITALGEGETITETFTVHTLDGTPQVVTITIKGTNNTPSLSAQSHAVTEDGLRLTGQMQGQDVDNHAQLTFSSPHVDGLTLHPDGSYQFDPSHSSYQHLKAQEVQTLSIPITVTDEHQASQSNLLTITITGTNDAAVITGVDTGTVTEDLNMHAAVQGGNYAYKLEAQGKLTAQDVDSGESGFDFKTLSTAALHPEWTPYTSKLGGYLAIDPDGNWNYYIDNRKPNIQALGAGETLTDTVTVQSKDGTPHLITLTIKGSNDQPEVSAEVSLASGTEDTPVTFSQRQLLANAHDIDSNNVGQLQISNLSVDHGKVVDNQDGTYTFSPDKNYHGAVHFSYDVNDGHGGVVHTGANTHLAAVNDTAVFTDTDTGAIQEDVHVQGDAQHTVAVSGVLTATDPDAGESAFLATRNAHAVNDPYGGTLSIGRSGDWTYSVPNSNIQNLAQGQTVDVVYQVVTRGGDSHNITITISGSNDAPVLTVNQTTPLQGTLTATDIDSTDTHHFSIANSAGQFGDLTLDPDTGAYHYTPHSSIAGMSYNAQSHTYHGFDVFELQLSDNHGSHTSKFITFDTCSQVTGISGSTPHITSAVPHAPLITNTAPSLPVGSNTPPVNSVTLKLAAGSDTGTSHTDNLTNDSHPTLMGHTAIPYSAVTLYDGNQAVAHAVADKNGDFSAVISGLTDGLHDLSAKALAPASLQPAISSIVPLQLDTQIAPLTVTLTHDTGIGGDLITSDGALTISGHEVGAVLEYSSDNGQTWHPSFTPQPGSNSVTVRQTDAAGNSATSAPLQFTLDNQVSAPQVSLVQDTSGQLHPVADLITQDARLNITHEAGATLEYSIDDGHTWSKQFVASQGSNQLQVRQTDNAGNVSSASHFSFTWDTIPGTVTVDPIAKDNAINAAENNQPLTITGTTSNVAVGDRVYVEIDSQHFYAATVQSNGTWQVTLSASEHQQLMAKDQDYIIKVGAVDVAGNVTPEISTHLLLDTQAPLPIINLNSVTKDNIINQLESGGDIQLTGQVSGDFNPGDTVSLSINGQAASQYSAQVDASGHYTVSVPAAVLLRYHIHTSSNQGHTVEASITTTDAAGNTGVASTGARPFSYDVNVNPLQLSLTHDTGVQTDHITRDASLTISGQEPGAVVEYSTDNGNSWHNSFTPQQGINQVSVRQTDVAGNVSASTDLTFTLDNQVAAPQVHLVVDSGDSSSDKLTNAGDLAITGTEPGAQVEYSVDQGVHWQTQFTPQEGNNQVQIRQVDVAGNVSAATSFHYQLDSQNDIRVNSAIIDRNGQSMSVQFYLPNDAEVSQLLISSDGGGAPLVVDLQASQPLHNGTSVRHPDHQYIKFNHIDLSALPDGNLNIQVAALDHAGNIAHAQSLGSYSSSLVLDRHASASDDSNQITEDAAQSISGNVLNNDTDAQQITTTGDLQGHYGLFHLNADGSYSYTLDNSLSSVQQLGIGSTPLTDTIQYTAADAAGNLASAHLTVSIHGSNDAPTLKPSFSSTMEDSPYRFSPADLAYQDIESDALHHITIEQVSHGSLSLNGQAVNVGDTVSANQVSDLIFTPTANYHGMAAVKYIANDGHDNSNPSFAFINVSPVDDAATFTGDSAGGTQEDIQLQASGTLIANDVDGSSGFIAVSSGTGIAGSKGLGHAHIDENGHWTYQLDNTHPAVQQLAAGQTETETVTVQAKDGTRHDILITITGSNDLPTVTEKAQAGVPLGAHSVTEDAGLTSSGQIIISDIDGDTTQVSLDPAHTATYGQVQFDQQSGTWVYQLDNNNSQVDALNDGDTLQDTFSLLVDDGHGGQVSKQIVMTINGHSDAPPLPSFTTPPKISGGAGHQDLHASLGVPQLLPQAIPSVLTGWGIADGHGHSVTSLHGQFGTLHINPATGDLHYDYNPSSGVIKTHTGGNTNTDETDTFLLTLGGSQNSHVAVHLHLHSQSVHGHSGHHIDLTTLTGMDIVPITPPPPPPPAPAAHDEPQSNSEPFSEMSFVIHQDTTADAFADGQLHQSAPRGATAYLDALGIESTVTENDEHGHSQAELPQDIDLVFNQADANDLQVDDLGHSEGLAHQQASEADDDDMADHDIDNLPDIDLPEDHNQHH